MPEINSTSTLEQLVSSAVASAPAEHGMPELVPDLVPEAEDLADTLIADRRRREIHARAMSAASMIDWFLRVRLARCVTR